MDELEDLLYNVLDKNKEIIMKCIREKILLEIFQFSYDYMMNIEGGKISDDISYQTMCDEFLKRFDAYVD